MSVTEDAPAQPAARRLQVLLHGSGRTLAPWWWLVIACSLVLVIALAAMGIWWVASSQSRPVSYRVIGTLSAIELDVGDADVEVTGGVGGAVTVQRTERYAFGRPPEVSRSEAAGVLRIASSCPETVIGTCGVAFSITVPDNVQVNIRTSRGRVRVTGLNGSASIDTGSGPIAVDGFCGFQLTATSASGDVRGAADCSPDRVELRSGSGDVHAVVPTGRYRVDANSDGGSVRVRNLVTSEDASYAIQAISGSGDVLVDGRR